MRFAMAQVDAGLIRSVGAVITAFWHGAGGVAHRLLKDITCGQQCCICSRIAAKAASSYPNEDACSGASGWLGSVARNGPGTGTVTRFRHFEHWDGEADDEDDE